MKRIFLTLTLISCSFLTSISASKGNQLLDEIKNSELVKHPRIFAPKLNVEKILANPLSKAIHESIIEEADKFEKLEPLKKKVVGRRMTHGDFIMRVYYLSYAYRTTGLKRYAIAAEREMLNACNYDSWNESHFLDTAGMTLGMGIGYDWLYDCLSEQSRIKILQAIKTKGLEKSKKHTFWKSSHNWNQVCSNGMLCGAIALLDSPQDRDFAFEIIARCVESLNFAYPQYEPDGVYPEGVSYWGYGTGNHVMFMAMLESSFGKNFGIKVKNGLKKSIKFMQFGIAPSNKLYNFSDCGENGFFQIPLVWMCKKIDDFSPLRPYVELLENYLSITSISKSYRLPFLLPIITEIELDKIPTPKEKLFVGHGITEIAVVRTSWTDKNAIYLAAKGGNGKAPHFHLDRGSFIFEMAGERWARDLPVMAYNFYESQGIKYFGGKEKLKLLRVSNITHNTLIVNDKIFTETASAPIVESFDTEAFRGAKMNTSELYAGELAKAFRTFAVVDNAKILIRDELSALPDKPAKVRWNMMTSAKVDIIDNQTIKLSQNGKSVVMRAKSDVKFVAKVFDCPVLVKGDKPITEAQAIGFEFTLLAGKNIAFDVEIFECTQSELNIF